MMKTGRIYSYSMISSSVCAYFEGKSVCCPFMMILIIMAAIFHKLFKKKLGWGEGGEGLSTYVWPK